MKIKAFEKYTTKELAQASGLSPSFISRCKSGAKKIPVPRAKRIRAQLGCSLLDLRPDVYEDED